MNEIHLSFNVYLGHVFEQLKNVFNSLLFAAVQPKKSITGIAEGTGGSFDEDHHTMGGSANGGVGVAGNEACQRNGIR